MALEELESFTYCMAHDMRAPLRAVNASCRLIAEEHGGKADPGARALLDSAMRAADFMNSFVDDLLRYARLAHAPVRKTKIDLTTLVASMLEGSLDVGAAADVSIEPGMQVVSDRLLTEVLVSELLDNAAKFRKLGSPLKVDVRLSRRDEADIISIADNGIGFEPQYAGRIFEPFQKLHPVSVYSGTGIGLACAKRIVERLGGKIWAESELGNGCAVYVALPHRFQYESRSEEPMAYPSWKKLIGEPSSGPLKVALN
jgi:light-regulated signal transduction histidine kinase (bacteriophytochrome)